MHLRKLGPNSIALITGKGTGRVVYLASLGGASVAGKPDISVRRYTDWPDGGIGEVILPACSELIIPIIEAYFADQCDARDRKATE